MSKFKRFRLLCLLFALLFCFQSFGLGASAAVDNLVDPNLKNWTLLDDKTKVVYTNNYYQLQYLVTTGDLVNVTVGAIYDASDLVAGNSYQLTFYTVLPSEMNLNDSRIYNQFDKGSLYIGLASMDYSTNTFSMVDNCYIEINKENYSRYFGYYTKFSFNMPNSVVNPCIVIGYLGSATTVTTYFGFHNVVLVDTAAEEEDDFLSKLFSWFEDKFNALGDGFTNLGSKLTEVKDSFVNKLAELKTSFENSISDLGDKLTDVKDSFVNKITDLKDSFVNKINELKTSFVNKITELKESFQIKIDEVKQGLIDLKNNLIDGIKSLFVPDEQAILDWKDSLNTLLKNHLGIIYTCSELLTDTLNLAFDIIFDAPDTYEVKIPEVSFEAAGTTVPVFSSQNIDFSFMEKPVFKTMYSMYTVAMYIFFGALEVKYALRVYRKVMNN